MTFKVLDLFCGQGGASMGYNQAGFEIVGVDIKNQPRYPFEFVRADALTFLRWHGHEFDLIHASPPCQAYSRLKGCVSKEHDELVEDVQYLLDEIGRPYVIENVVGAPLRSPLMLCGSMFGLRVIRHRLFECKPMIWFPPASCNHWGACAPTGGPKRKKAGKILGLQDGFAFISVVGNGYLAAEGRQAMGINWMSKAGLSQAIPPAYTKYIGQHMMVYLREQYYV